jgi:hypothetical protein
MRWRVSSFQKAAPIPGCPSSRPPLWRGAAETGDVAHTGLFFLLATSPTPWAFVLCLFYFFFSLLIFIQCEGRVAGLASLSASLVPSIEGRDVC